MILYVLRYYPTLTETFVYREIDELYRRGVPVVVAALGSRPDGRLQDELPDVPVLRAPRGLASWRAAPSLRLLPRDLPAVRWLAARQRPRHALRALWLADQARTLGVVRVHAHFAGEAAEVGWLVSRQLDVPFSVTVHAVDLFKPRPSLGALLRQARPACTVSAHNAEVILARYGVAAEVVRMGVDTQRFRPAPVPPARRPPVRAICVARYAPKKGIDSLLQVVRALPEPVELRLVSDGPDAVDAPWLHQGPLPPSRIPGALARSDLFVLPCRVAPDGDRDGVPVALLEAMAAGLPVVTTRVSGIPELVDEAVGWLVEPDDPDALAGALGEAIRDPARRRVRGQAARKRILERRLTVDSQVDALLRAWEAA